MPLDQVASVACLLIAMALFTLQVITGPRHGPWMNFPAYVRYGLLASGVTFSLMGVNLTWLANRPEGFGHVNAVTALGLMVFAYTICALTFWVLSIVKPGALRWTLRSLGLPAFSRRALPVKDD